MPQLLCAYAADPLEPIGSSTAATVHWHQQTHPFACSSKQRAHISWQQIETANIVLRSLKSACMPVHTSPKLN